MSKYARNDDPQTSHDAADSIDVAKLEAMVLTEIRKSGKKGMTQDELLLAFPHLAYSSVTARPAALKRKNLIANSGKTRPGRTGRQQTILVAVEYADVIVRAKSGNELVNHAAV